MTQKISSSEKKQYSFYDVPLPQSDENDWLEEILQFFKSVPAHEKVYVGVSDTSRVFINNIVLPFLLEQKVATKYHELHTGIVTTQRIQMEMKEEMETAKYVILWDYFLCEPNKGCESTNIHILDEYIQENFSLIQQIGYYKILMRKEKSLPHL